jgi:hypothetical protein
MSWIDVRSQLARSSTVPQVSRSVTNFAVIHYNGPSVLKNAQGQNIWNGDLALLKADARFHVNVRGWDGLSYTYAIGREKTNTGQAKAYQCRDWSAKLAHAGNSLMNDEAFAFFMVTGDSDLVPDYMFKTLQERLYAVGIERRYWLGHQESPRSTSCPGAPIMRWLKSKRDEIIRRAVGVKVKYNANIRDESSVLSAVVGSSPAGATWSGEWCLGKPVKGDSLWLRISGDRYIHASALDARNYVE